MNTDADLSELANTLCGLYGFSGEVIVFAAPATNSTWFDGFWTHSDCTPDRVEVSVSGACRLVEATGYTMAEARANARTALEARIAIIHSEASNA